MYSEGQDRSGRERRIPINVEPRSSVDNEARKSSARQQYQTPSNKHSHHNQEFNPTRNYGAQTRNDNSQSGNDHRQTSPNTSSINIDYQPPHHQTQREQNKVSKGANSHNSRTNEERQGDGRDQHLNEHQTRTKSPSPRDAPPNGDKKVNSPEPIPLPPPPEQQGQNKASGSTSPNADSSNQENSSPMSEEEIILSKISAVKVEITELLKKISQFTETSAKSKEYRFIDEMLTRCVLNLDKIECGSSPDMRQRRRATIKLVDQTTSILQRKLQINTDIHDLTISMST